LFLSGDFDAAVKAAGALTDAGLAARLVEAAVYAGAAKPAGLSSAVSAALALKNGDAQGALDGVLSELGEGTGDAAVMVARAVAAGAVIPEETEVPAPTQALIKWASSTDARRARAHANTASGVKGWRADELRAERAVAWGDTSGANAAYAALAGAADPRAQLKGLLGKLDGLRIRKSFVGTTELLDWATRAHEIAQAEGTMDQVQRASQHAFKANKQLSNFAAALEVALAAKFTAEASGTDATEATLMAANASLLVGDPVSAATLAEAVRTAVADEASDAHQRAAWTSGMAAWSLGRTAALETASAAARGARKDALKALVAFSRGDLETARLQFPPSGLAGEEAAQVYGWAAAAEPAKAGLWHDRAIKGADATRITALRVSTRLAKESWLRRFNRRGAASVRQATSRLSSSASLAGELAVRNMLAGGKGSISAEMGPASGIWRALATNQMPKKIEGEIWSGLLSWARGRAAAASGRLEGHDGHFPAALGKLPLHRTGRLALGTAVDGSEGVDLEKDVALLRRIGGEMATGLALSAHDIGHRMNKTHLDLSLGMDQVYGVSDEAREALLAAVSKARADVSAWHMGQMDFPEASLDAVAAAEDVAAGTSDAFKTLLPLKGSTAQDLLVDLRRGAVLSYRAAHGQIQAVVLSREGNGIKDLGSTAEIFKLANDYRQAMMLSAPDAKTKTEHSAGHFLRTKLVDPFIGELTGIGRYVIVGPPELTAYPFTAMPEQAEGLRWLADIRQMAASPTVSDLQRDMRDVTPDTYKLDFLAFGGAKKAPDENELTNFEAPNELRECGRYFKGGFDAVKIGDEATLEVWREHAPTARYIHLAELSPGMNGGFQFADGTLSLNEVRNTEINAVMVVITARADPAQQQHRARAFLDAGARWVLVVGWDILDRHRVRYLTNIYESMNQERPPVRALSEGRNRLISNGMSNIDMDDPAIWAGLTLFGKP
jgi:hypothetical protein